MLAAAMIVTGCPSHYVKADTAKKQVTLSVQSQTAKPGATVDVTVDVKDNPGILGAAVSLKYDEGLTLTDATAGDAFSSLVLTKPGKIQSPCKFVWDGQEITADDIKDGTILKLSFKVSDTAKSGESYKISVSCDAGDMVDADLNAVDVKTEDGEIGISAFTPGDLNEDNKKRQELAAYYYENIKNPLITLPVRIADENNVYHQFPIFCERRDELQKFLADNGVQTLIHYPIPPHHQECYVEAVWNKPQLSLPISEKIHEQELSIPMNQVISMEEAKIVVDVLNAFK